MSSWSSRSSMSFWHCTVLHSFPCLWPRSAAFRQTSFQSLEKHEVAIIRVADTNMKQVWRTLVADGNEPDLSGPDDKVDSPIIFTGCFRKQRPLSRCRLETSLRLAPFRRPPVRHILH